jgi:hypothetical protein
MIDATQDMLHAKLQISNGDFALSGRGLDDKGRLGRRETIVGVAASTLR